MIIRPAELQPGDVVDVDGSNYIVKQAPEQPQVAVVLAAGRTDRGFVQMFNLNDEVHVYRPDATETN